MSMGREREKTIDAVRWVIVLLAVLTAWECARAVNAALHEKGLLTAGQMLNSLNTVVAGAKGAPPLTERLSAFAEQNGGVLAACLFALGMVAMVTRMLFASPLLDHLYLESSARDRRTMTGFLVTVGGLLLQMALLYAMVLFARPGGASYSGMVPVLLAVYLLGGAVWMLLIRVGAGGEDKQALRGFLAALGVNVVVGALLVGALGYASRLADHNVAKFHGNRPNNLALAAVAGLVVCTLDTFLQGRIYGKRGKGSLLRNVLMLVVLLVVLAVGGYLVYRTAPHGLMGKGA